MKFITSPLSNQITEFTELHSEFNVPAKMEENHGELITKQISVLTEGTRFTLLKTNNKRKHNQPTNKPNKIKSAILHLLKEKGKVWNKIITSHLTGGKMTVQNSALH